MTEADYADISYGGTISNDKYTEKLTYDIRGNIQTLQRNGYNASNCSWGQIDNLTYQYDPNNQGYNPYNKLYSITDYADVSRGFITQSNGTAYSYDVDGNMTADPNKGITGISYNHLNLPEIITFTGNRTITFLYDGSGNKLRKTVVNSGVTQYTKDYVNGIEYKNNALEAIYHSEGRVTTIDGTLKYEYALKDHLGNTRIMFCDRNYDGIITPNSNAETSELTQENSYYAFGMNMEFGTWENTPSVTDNLHQYNGKELNTDFGLNWNDYGARFYDPALGRFTTTDPLSEISFAQSPYLYAANNPISNIDFKGLYDLPVIEVHAERIKKETKPAFGFDGLIESNDAFWKRAKNLAKGAYNAVISNSSFGLARIDPDDLGDSQETDDFENGQTVGDLLSIVLGGGEIVLGDGVGTVSAAASGPTLGLSISGIGLGVGIAIEGVSTSVNGIGGIVNRFAKYSKKQAREQAKQAQKDRGDAMPEKRMDQETKGLTKDQKRRVHDAKKKGQKDRSLEQVRRDVEEAKKRKH